MESIKFELESVVSCMKQEIELTKAQDARDRAMGMEGTNWKLANQLEILKHLEEALLLADFNKETGMGWPKAHA